MAYTLPPLPYPFNALEPSIDAKTMEIHHGKHHNAYVTNLNTAIAGQSKFENLPIAELCARIMELPENIRAAVRNNGGGHYNHSLFWTLMATPGKGGGGEPTGDLADAIKKSFGSFADFKTKLSDAAVKRFGSGWAWLGIKDDGSLVITSTPNQDNPLMKGLAETPCTPILGVDVWEHAYYLLYQNRRPDYLTEWWNVVNWSAVAKEFAKARQLAAV